MTSTVITTTTTKLVETSCWSCKCPFMMPDWLAQQSRETERPFYCPACGSQNYFGEGEVARLRRQLKEDIKAKHPDCAGTDACTS